MDVGVDVDVDGGGKRHTVGSKGPAMMMMMMMVMMFNNNNNNNNNSISSK